MREVLLVAPAEYIRIYVGYTEIYVSGNWAKTALVPNKQVIYWFTFLGGAHGRTATAGGRIQ